MEGWVAYKTARWGFVAKREVPISHGRLGLFLFPVFLSSDIKCLIVQHTNPDYLTLIPLIFSLYASALWRSTPHCGGQACKKSGRRVHCPETLTLSHFFTGGIFTIWKLKRRDELHSPMTLDATLLKVI